MSRSSNSHSFSSVCPSARRSRLIRRRHVRRGMSAQDQFNGRLSDVRAFDAWFPKTIYFHRSSAERRQTERLRFAGGYQTRDGMR